MSSLTSICKRKNRKRKKHSFINKGAKQEDCMAAGFADFERINRKCLLRPVCLKTGTLRALV